SQSGLGQVSEWALSHYDLQYRIWQRRTFLVVAPEAALSPSAGTLRSRLLYPISTGNRALTRRVPYEARENCRSLHCRSPKCSYLDCTSADSRWVTDRLSKACGVPARPFYR